MEGEERTGRAGRDFWELEARILEWGEKHGIIEHGTPLGQQKKTEEEVQELRDAIEAGDAPKIKDGIGDTAVTLILQCALQGLTLEECLDAAYNEIAPRTGRMEGGTFIKDRLHSQEEA